MLDKLQKMEENYRNMQGKMLDPAILSDNQQYAQLMREYKHMQPIIEKYHAYQQELKNNKEEYDL